MWYFSISVNDLDLVDGMNRRRQAAVYAKYLIVDHHAQSEEVEHIGEIMPNIRIAVLSGTLGVEAIRLRDAS